MVGIFKALSSQYWHTTLNHHPVTINGRLCWNATYMTNYTSESAARGYANALHKLLVETVMGDQNKPVIPASTRAGWQASSTCRLSSATGLSTNTVWFLLSLVMTFTLVFLVHDSILHDPYKSVQRWNKHSYSSLFKKYLILHTEAYWLKAKSFVTKCECYTLES